MVYGQWETQPPYILRGSDMCPGGLWFLCHEFNHLLNFKNPKIANPDKLDELGLWEVR